MWWYGELAGVAEVTDDGGGDGGEKLVAGEEMAGERYM